MDKNFGLGKPLRSHTVPELKEILKKNGLAITGLKQELIDRLQEFFQKNQKPEIQKLDESEKKPAPKLEEPSAQVHADPKKEDQNKDQPNEKPIDTKVPESQADNTATATKDGQQAVEETIDDRNEGKRKRDEYEEIEGNIATETGEDDDDPWASVAQKRQKTEDLDQEQKPPYFLAITGLKRPFPLPVLKNELLGKHLSFWLNSIRSCCLTSYNTDFERGEVLEAMHDRVWPDEPKRPKLQAKKLTQQEAKIFEETDGKQTSLETSVEAAPEPTDEEDLSKLFRLTNTEPRLYYLPLTPEQGKLRQQNKTLRRKPNALK